MFLPRPTGCTPDLLPETAEPTAVLILGTVAPPRFRQPRELLSFRGKTMLLRSIETALALQCGPVAVAVGRATESMRQTIAAKKLLLIEDVQFLDGQGAAIRKGLSSLLLHTPHLKGLLVTSCDQPLVNARSLRDLIHAETLLAASAYLGTSGAPVWFGRPLFDELLSLQDHDGIRPLVDAHRRDLTTVSIPEAAIDIETFASLAALAP